MVTMICESDKITMAIAIIASFLWVFKKGFSVLANAVGFGCSESGEPASAMGKRILRCRRQAVQGTEWTQAGVEVVMMTKLAVILCALVACVTGDASAKGYRSSTRWLLKELSCALFRKNDVWRQRYCAQRVSSDVSLLEVGGSIF